MFNLHGLRQLGRKLINRAGFIMYKDFRQARMDTEITDTDNVRCNGVGECDQSHDNAAENCDMKTNVKEQTDIASIVTAIAGEAAKDVEITAEDAGDDLSVNDEIKATWEKQQNEYKQKLIIDDVEDWSRNWLTDPVHEDIKYVGGVDISFVKGDNINACAAFVVLKFPELEVVYEDLSMVELTAPYIPGFLAFREADFLVDKVEKLRREQPELLPQVTLVDGNGILHPRGFGLASQFGVICDVATIGVAKNFYHVDGMEKDEAHAQRIASLADRGDTFDLVGVSGTLWGRALRTSTQATKPVFVSPGHKVSVDTAVAVVHYCAKVRVPEPTRQADIKSREYLRLHWDTEEKRAK